MTYSRSTLLRSTLLGSTLLRFTLLVTAAVGVLSVLGPVTWSATTGPGKPAAEVAPVSRIGPLPEGASVTRSDSPAGRLLQEAADRARQDRVSRAASRTVSFDRDVQALAGAMMARRYGWGDAQFSCLSSLWEAESSWDVTATNPSSGAYGIPQALPAAKMAAAGPDWRSNPATQITWGLSYVESSYGTPCGAWSAYRSQGWY